MGKDDNVRSQSKILGDIEPDPDTRDHLPGPSGVDDEDDTKAMSGGSGNDPDERAGNRDVTGNTGGVGPETGGTRNFRRGSGATGGDIGNRPE
jgi:hypothetical protein